MKGLKSQWKKKRKERRNATSADFVYVEAMSSLELRHSYKETRELFIEAVKKGHEESKKIVKILPKDNTGKINSVFLNTNDPVALYFDAKLCRHNNSDQKIRESAESGYSWAQIEYAHRNGALGNNMLNLAVAQNNPRAFVFKGRIAELHQNRIEGIQWYVLASRMGYITASDILVNWGRNNFNLFMSVQYSCSNSMLSLWELVRDVHHHCCSNSSGSDYLKFHLGKGLYWNHRFKMTTITDLTEKENLFIKECIDCYCTTIDRIQNSILLFLLFWNKNNGIKDVGKIIGQIVWNERYYL